jgi:hypothetical protein
VCGIAELNLNRGSVQREVISDLKGENQLLSNDIWERSVTGFKTGFYGVWQY